MIPVAPEDEPDTFDATVRQPGLRAIAELVGERPPRESGRPFAKVADFRNDIPPAGFHRTGDALLVISLRNTIIFVRTFASIFRRESVLQVSIT